MKKDKRGLAVHAGRAHDRDRDKDSMSPAIRWLAISWGGPHEITPPLKIEERVLEAGGRN